MRHQGAGYRRMRACSPKQPRATPWRSYESRAGARNAFLQVAAAEVLLGVDTPSLTSGVQQVGDIRAAFGVRHHRTEKQFGNMLSTARIRPNRSKLFYGKRLALGRSLQQQPN